MRGLSALLSCLAGAAVGVGAAQAQWIADGVDVQTEAGLITIVDSADGWSRELHVGEERYFTDSQYRYVNIEAQLGGLYLVSLGSGGTACAAVYAWLKPQSTASVLTEEFGNCSDLAEVSHDAETVTVTLPSMHAAEGFVAFVYDGKTIEEGVLGQEASGIGRDADAWVGRYPFEVLRDADWRAALTDLMGEEGYRLAGDVIATSSPFEVQGQWVAGSGFNRRMAGDAHGAIAIHREDGRVVVAIRTEESGLQVWGDLSGVVPETIERVVQRR